MLRMPVVTVVGDVSILIFPMAKTPGPEIASISAVVIASLSSNSDTCCLSLVQEGFVGTQPRVHPVDVAGEINYEDHKNVRYRGDKRTVPVRTVAKEVTTLQRWPGSRSAAG